LKQADQVTVVVGETKSETGEVAALKKRIAQLEAENESLRQLISSRNEREPSPSRSNDDSVREQRHNFFKYSNVRKY
jgi:ribosomal protein L24